MHKSRVHTVREKSIIQANYGIHTHTHAYTLVDESDKIPHVRWPAAGEHLV